MSTIYDKKLSLQDAVLKRINLEKEGKKLVVTNGCFDLLHCGHMYFLMRARAKGDCLFVLMNSDYSVQQLKGLKRPIIPEKDRMFQLSCLDFVDGVILFPFTNCAEALRQLKPDVYVKGLDYDANSINKDERDVLMSIPASIEFIPLLPEYSTTNLITKIQKLMEED